MSEMSAAIVLLPGDDQPQVGRLVSQKPGASLRVEMPDGLTRKMERPQLLATLQSQASTLAQAQATVQALRARIAATELDAVWSLLDGRQTGVTELAELLLGAATPENRDAVLVAVAWTDDGFLLANAQVQRRDPAARLVQQAQHARRLACQRESAPWLARIDALRAGQARRREDPQWLQRLEAFARAEHGESPPDAAIAWLLQRRSRHQTATPRDAAEMLRELGAWDGHDDLALWRSGLLEPWPEVALPEPELEMAALDLPLVTIDNDTPHEVDDAVACAREGDGWRVWIAIANPTPWVTPGSALDREANRRGATFYHPRHIAGLLPDALACVRASLLPGQPRPVLLFEVGLTATGKVRDTRVREAVVTVARAWSYNRLDAALTANEPGLAMLRDLLAACSAAEGERIRNGAYLLYKPDVEVKAPRHGALVLGNVAQTSPTRRMVTEAMVLCSAAAGRFCAEHRLAVPFRGQPPPVQPPLPPGLYTDPVQIHAILKTLQPPRTSLQPEAHGVLGVPAYVQVTSPLRRYTDLLAHRQIAAHLRGLPAPHTAQDVLQRVALAEQGASERRQWQRRADRYFKLVWLAGRGIGTRLHAVAVRRLGPGQVLAWLPEPGLETPVAAGHAEPGEELLLTVRNVEAASGEVQLVAR